jgi:hypothetical protein
MSFRFSTSIVHSLSSSSYIALCYPWKYYWREWLLCSISEITFLHIALPKHLKAHFVKISPYHGYTDFLHEPLLHAVLSSIFVSIFCYTGCTQMALFLYEPLLHAVLSSIFVKNFCYTGCTQMALFLYEPLSHAVLRSIFVSIFCYTGGTEISLQQNTCLWQKVLVCSQTEQNRLL